MQVRAADVVATSRLVCYCLCRRDFAELLGTADEVWRFEALQKVCPQPSNPNPAPAVENAMG